MTLTLLSQKKIANFIKTLNVEVGTNLNHQSQHKIVQGSLVILRTQKTVQAGTTVEKVLQLVIAVPQVWLGTKEIVHANGLIKFYPVKNKKKLEPLYSHVLKPKIDEEEFILSMLIPKIAGSIFFALRVRLENMGAPWGQFSKSIRMELMGFAMILKKCLNVSTIMGI